ncbi:MAG: radical SAM protein [Magnetococcales bacterium]|nr:radical SAM protein [Magnetococcales bacterium]
MFFEVKVKKDDKYLGFEQGPIRPPSEASSLKLRITRNCPWNQCKFCRLYEGETFSVRPTQHVIEDIDKISQHIYDIQNANQTPNWQMQLSARQATMSTSDKMAFHAALKWYRCGMNSIFLQDANTMVVKSQELIKILEHIQKRFPQVNRITSYARSHTIARKSTEEMAQIAEAGLNRIHIGMESAANEVLQFINKRVDKKTHIIAGLKVKEAGIELSEYYMPGLGGEEFSTANAMETADAMNQINPDFIRIRTLAIPQETELYQEVQSGNFIPLGDVQMAKELMLFLQNLNGIQSRVESDHILNLFQDVDGKLPDEKEKMTTIINSFLAMDPQVQMLYMVGRRTGIFSRITDIEDPYLNLNANQAIADHGVTMANVEEWTAAMVRQYI